MQCAKKLLKSRRSAAILVVPYKSCASMNTPGGNSIYFECQVMLQTSARHIKGRIPLLLEPMESKDKVLQCFAAPLEGPEQLPHGAIVVY